MRASRCPRGAYLLTALVSGRSRRSRSPSGCTFPWGTARHGGESAGKTGEVQQPLFRNRPRDRAAARDLPPLEGKGPGPVPSGSLSAPAMLSRATLMGEGQAVPWGRAGGPGEAGDRLLGPGGRRAGGHGGAPVPA